MRKCSLLLLLSLLSGLLFHSQIYAEKSSFTRNQWLRIRLGAAGTGNISTIVYEAGLPTSLSGLAGVSGVSTVSTNIIGGGSGVYNTRIVTDVNARSSARTPLTGNFYYDSSAGVDCTTNGACGNTKISFLTISWLARDSDNNTEAYVYNGLPGQKAHSQVDNNSSDTGVRHRNYLQYTYSNFELLPAGTYEGLVEFSGEGEW